MTEGRIITAPLWLQTHIVLLTTPVALLFYLFLPPQPLLLFACAFYYVFAAGLHLYIRRGEAQLAVQDKQASIRLFPGESGTLPLVMENNGRLPITNSACLFRIPAALQLPDGQRLVTLSLAMPARTQLMHHVPFLANRRGTYRLQQVELIIGEPFGLMRIHQPPLPRLQTEVIVYPTPFAVIGPAIAQLLYGAAAVSASPYRDESVLAGIQRYERESFRAIHWSASAKTGVLQAKQFAMVAHQSWSILLSLGAHGSIGWKPDMENLISYAAFLCQTAAKHNILFELFISIQANGAPVHLPARTGTAQLTAALEELARITEETTVLPPELFAAYCMRKRDRFSSVVTIGLADGTVTAESLYVVHDDGRMERKESAYALRTR